MLETGTQILRSICPRVSDSKQKKTLTQNPGRRILSNLYVKVKKSSRYLLDQSSRSINF